MRDERSTHDRQRLADELDELSILMPALRDALERDQGASAGERVSGAGEVLSLPINPDVLKALRQLEHEVPAIAYRAAEEIGEPYVGRGVEGHVRHFPRQHERLLALAAVDEAKRLAAGVSAVLHGVKLALGLRTRDRKLGRYCPLHDVELVELVAPGEVGHLRYERLIDGQPVNPTVSWLKTDAVLCRVCGASWVPAQYYLLARMIAEAEERRTGGRAA